MPLQICDPPDISQTQGIAECNAKCMQMVGNYVAAVNATNPSQPATADTLECRTSNVTVFGLDCPAMLTEGGEPPFSGGPAQYVANLTGNTHVSVTVDTGIPGVGSVTVSSDSPTSGQVGYAIFPLNRVCPPLGCKVVMTAFNLAVADFEIGLTIFGQTFFSHTVTGMRIQNAGWITGTWQPNGHFEIPPNAGRVAVNASDNGVHSSMERFNTDPITGTIDPVTGVVSFDTFSQTEGNATTTISGLAGPNISAPPVAVISAPPATVECNRPNSASVTLDGSASTAPNNDLRFFAWMVNGGTAISGSQVNATLALGANNVVLNVFNSTLGIGIATRAVTVVDTTPPTIATLPTATVGTCSDGLTVVTLTPPAASDVCSPVTTVTGSVISSSPPIPIVDGRVSLPPGTHTVRWTASDGVRTATSTQTVVVQPGILVNGQFVMQDRARLQTTSSGSAGVGNAGSILTRIGNDAVLGDILSVAPVVLLDRVTVQGGIRSTGTITLGHGDNVAGSVVPQVPVSLPPVPNLSGVVFPPPTGGNRTFNATNPPGQTVPLAPGSYGTVTLNSGARVSLSAGTYYFQQLLLNTASSTLVVPATGVTRLYVATQLAYRGQIVTPAGQLGQIFLGYNGTSAAVLEAPFLGTLVAPRGQVSIGTASAQTFRGRFFGSNIEVRPDIRLVCDTTVTAQ